MDTPGLLPTRKHWHSLTHRSRHTHTHPLSDTSRAISNQSRWLLRSSLNGGPDLRYAALFPPSPNFQATRGKGVWEKWREREHAILLFLNKSSTHLILLPNLQSPETAYSGMRRYVEEVSEACWENSLQHFLEVSSEIVKMQSFPTALYMQLQLKLQFYYIWKIWTYSAALRLSLLLTFYIAVHFQKW